MAPQLINNMKIKKREKETSKYKEINTKIKDYQNFIKKNFKYVGENFAFEARSIHYNDKKENKGIYGTASNDEIKELREEGINAEIVPWVNDKSN